MEFIYTFKFDGEKEKRFFVPIDDNKLIIQREKVKNFPVWCSLGFHKCRGCSLGKPFCPAATAIAETAEYFISRSSCQIAQSTIHLNGKSMEKQGSLETSLSSLFGILLWTSKCPIFGNLNFLLLNFNPYAATNEFFENAVSAFIKLKGVKAAEKEKLFFELFEAVKDAGKYFCKRLSENSDCDANRNALIRLDSLYTGILQFKGRDIFKTTGRS